LGFALDKQGRVDDAVAHYERALAINPDHAEAHNNLGNIRKEQGRFEDAMAHYGRAIAIRPDYAEIHYNRAEIKVFHSGDVDLLALEALAERNDLSANQATHVHFALAKALEDCGDYPRSFEHLRKGNALKRRQINYDEASAVKRFQSIPTVFDNSLLERFRGDGELSSVPIFVLGMPRSGSTLVEQILASHPRIHGAGELNDLEVAACSVLNAGDQPLPFPECIAADGAVLRRIGQAYISRLPALADGKVRIVDKLPCNFLNIGLIRMILPNARIIHTVRHPVDTCVSCYSKLFTTGQHFSYDLAELGRYYRGYSELMTHWRSVLPPGALLDVAYEDVVDDLEGQARRMIDYCGLPWDDRCLSFDKTNRPIKTSSSVQVRKPLFRSSLQRWHRYEAGLAPLLRELGDIAAGHESFHSA
jgi:tetratricopeptide (TPR) repeat protein